jgi:hypothetical protein
MASYEPGLLKLILHVLKRFGKHLPRSAAVIDDRTLSLVKPMGNWHKKGYLPKGLGGWQER